MTSSVSQPNTFTRSLPTPAQQRVVNALAALQCRIVGDPGRGQYMAQCPAHDDRTPSLSVGYGFRDGVGRVLLNCHAACDMGAVCEALGIAECELFDGDRANFQKRTAPFDFPKASDNPNVAKGSSFSTVGSASANAQAQAPVQVPIDTGDSAGSLIDRFRAIKAGRAAPEWTVPLRFDLLAPNAVSARSGLESVGILMGLQLEDGDTRPCPVSCSLYARLMGWPDPGDDGARRASRHLRAFVNLKTLRLVGSLDPLYGRSAGTHLYQPFAFDLVDLFEGRLHEVVDTDDAPF